MCVHMFRNSSFMVLLSSQSPSLQFRSLLYCNSNASIHKGLQRKVLITIVSRADFKHVLPPPTSSTPLRISQADAYHVLVTSSLAGVVRR